jgi:hypothetical protein
MFAGAVEPECRQPLRVSVLGIIHSKSGTTATVQTPAAILTLAGRAPDREAINGVTHATLHAKVNGATTPKRELFVTAAPTGVGACGASNWANSITVN